MILHSMQIVDMYYVQGGHWQTLHSALATNAFQVGPEGMASKCILRV